MQRKISANTIDKILFFHRFLKGFLTISPHYHIWHSLTLCTGTNKFQISFFFASMKQKQERSWFVVEGKKLVEYGKILLNLVFKRKLGKLLNLVTQFHFCIGRVGISTLVKFVLVFYWRVQRLLKEMQGQVTFLSQNGLILFGITNPKSKRKKQVVLTENLSLFFQKKCFQALLLTLIAQEEICV